MGTLDLPHRPLGGSAAQRVKSAVAGVERTPRECAPESHDRGQPLGEPPRGGGTVG